MRLTIPKEEGIKYVLKFDPSQVADAVNNAQSAGSVEENEEMDEDGDADYEEDKMPFNVTIEVHRNGVSKTLCMEAEVSPSYEEDGDKYDMYISDVRVNKVADDSVGNYSGPSFDALDDALRDQFDQFANKNFRKFMPLVADYAKAKEAALYNGWLHDVKEIVAGKD